MTTTKAEYTNDSNEKVASGAVKYDGGKAPIFRGALLYFPRAMEKVAAVSQFGASKYAWNGWRNVDDGYNRYSDAMVRHLAYEGKGEVLDPESGLPHAAHAAWNALARLELALHQEEQMELWAKTSPEAAEIKEYIDDSYYLNPEKTNEKENMTNG